MPTTSPYGLPYPDDNAFVIDGPSAIQGLAEAVDDLVALVVFDRDQADAALDTRVDGQLGDFYVQAGTGLYTVAGGVITITFPTPFPGGRVARVTATTAVGGGSFAGATAFVAFSRSNTTAELVPTKMDGTLVADGQTMQVDWQAIA